MNLYTHRPAQIIWLFWREQIVIEEQADLLEPLYISLEDSHA